MAPLVRAATLSDLDRVREISTYYVLNTVINFAYHPPTQESVVSNFEGVKDRGLPYLVALDSPPDCNTGSEKVIGYTYVGPFPSTRLAYAQTLELSIFVDHKHHEKGVGSALLRALLDELKTTKHLAFEPGYEHPDQRREVLAENLIAKMSYETAGPAEEYSEKLRQWYIRWGFTEVSRMEDVGYKFGRHIGTVDLMLDLKQYYAKMAERV